MFPKPKRRFNRKTNLFKCGNPVTPLRALIIGYFHSADSTSPVNEQPLKTEQDADDEDNEIRFFILLMDPPSVSKYLFVHFLV